MLESIVPPTIMVAESTGEPIDQLPLYAEEAALLANTTARRRAEFTSGRACARNALAQLGLQPAPIPRGPSGGPQWPAGVVGSITHCAGYQAAAAGWHAAVTAIGIDAEPHRPLRSGLLELITSPAERTCLAELRRIAPEVCWDRLLFSAKESIYKAWYPRTSTWLDFAEAEVSFSSQSNEFTARLLIPAPPDLAEMTGRWLVTRGLAISAVVVTAAGRHVTAPSLPT